METVTCMSLEEMEWSISIAEEQCCTAEHLHLPWDKDNKYDVIVDQLT